MTLYSKHDWYTLTSTVGSGAPYGPWQGWDGVWNALTRYLERNRGRDVQREFNVRFAGPYCTRREALTAGRDGAQHQLCPHRERGIQFGGPMLS